MTNPTAVYPVQFNGTTLPGYAQGEDLPLNMRLSSAEILGRAGGTLAQRGTAMRDVSVTMRVLSRLSTGTEIAHLRDCYDQWESALETCIQPSGSAQLKIGRTDRYLDAMFVSSTAPKQVPESSRRMSYTLTFKANPPYFIGTTVSGSASVSGATTITTNIGATLKTYPVITIPSTITHITITDSGTSKSFTLSGTHSSAWVVDCATLQITTGSNNAASQLTSSPDFGIYHVGSGSLVLSTSNVTGSGTVSVTMKPRYGR